MNMIFILQFRFFKNLTFISLFLSTSSCQIEDVQHNNVFIANFPYDKACAISFTFDDNCASCHSLIAPLFNQFGYKATFFVVTDQIKDWDTWKDLSLDGFEIGNHSASHINMAQVYDSAILSQQINASYEVISQNIGQPPVSYAHPGHGTNPT